MVNISKLDNSVQYEDAITSRWCRDSWPIPGRHKCNSSEQCIENARGLCDDDPNCFGVMWFSGNLFQKLSIASAAKLKTLVSSQLKIHFTDKYYLCMNLRLNIHNYPRTRP